MSAIKDVLFQHTDTVIAMALASLIVMLVYIEKFEQLTENLAWDPPPRYLTSAIRYNVWRLLYVLLALIAFLGTWYLFDPICAGIEGCAEESFTPLTRVFAAAFIVTGLALDTPIAKRLEGLVRRRFHILALIPKRSSDLVAYIESANLRDDDAFRTEAVEGYGAYGITKAHFDAPRNTFENNWLRTIHLFHKLSSDWSVRLPYSTFFRQADSRWDDVDSTYDEILNSVRVYLMARTSVDQVVEQHVHKRLEDFLERLHWYISYIILSVDRKQKNFKEQLADLDLLAEGVPWSPGWSVVAFATIVMYFALSLVIGSLFYVATWLGVTGFRPGIAFGLVLLMGTINLAAIMFVLAFKRRGVNAGTWPLPQKAETAPDFFQRPWDRYGVCLIGGLALGGGIILAFVFLNPRITDPNLYWTALYGIFPGLTGFFFAYLIDTHSDAAKPVIEGLAQGIVTAAVIFPLGFVVWANTEGTIVPNEWAKITIMTIIAFVVGMGTGSIIAQFVRKRAPRE